MAKRMHRGFDSKPVGTAIQAAITKLRKLRAKVAPEEKKHIDLRINELTRCYASVKDRCGKTDPWYLPPPPSPLARKAQRK